MLTINPYLNFKGNTEEAFNFYRSVFGGEFTAVNRFKETPHGQNLSESDGEKIMHISLPIGNNITLRGTDALESMGQTLTVGDNYHLSIETKDKDEADKIFNALSVGGEIKVPLQDMFWNAYFGMFIDKFGISWMVNCEKN